MPKLIQNPNCGGGYCIRETGEVRVLPTGGASNAILCHACFVVELTWRRERNRDLAGDAQFDLPKWQDLKIYDPGS